MQLPPRTDLPQLERKELEARTGLIRRRRRVERWFRLLRRRILLGGDGGRADVVNLEGLEVEEADEMDEAVASVGGDRGEGDVGEGVLVCGDVAAAVCFEGQVAELAERGRGDGDEGGGVGMDPFLRVFDEEEEGVGREE